MQQRCTEDEFSLGCFLANVSPSIPAYCSETLKLFLTHKLWEPQKRQGAGNNKVRLDIGKVNWSLKKKKSPRALARHQHIQQQAGAAEHPWKMRRSSLEAAVRETSRTEVSNGLGLIQPLSVTGEWCGGCTGWGGGFAWQNVHFNCSFSFFFFFFFECDLIANYGFCICN